MVMFVKAARERWEIKPKFADCQAEVDERGPDVCFQVFVAEASSAVLSPDFVIRFPINDVALI